MKVELRPALAWTCDECGRDNFEHVLVPPLSVEESTEVKKEMGLEGVEQGTLYCRPESVECAGCGAEFQTDFYGE